MLGDLVIGGDGSLLFYGVACCSHCHACIIYKKHNGGIVYIFLYAFSRVTVSPGQLLPGRVGLRVSLFYLVLALFCSVNVRQ